MSNVATCDKTGLPRPGIAIELPADASDLASLTMIEVRETRVRPGAAVLALATMLVASPQAAAQRIPALFEIDEADRSFPGLLLFPDVTGDFSIMMLCASQIEASGKMKETGCMIRNNGEAVFGEVIKKAAKKARLAPASIDGKEQKVYLQFRVEFIKEGDAKKIRVYANTGDAENVDAYGDDYVAAQRVIGKEPWMKVCPARAQYGLTARAHVSAEGVASSVSLQHGYGITPTGTCQQAIAETIENSPFTPAMVENEPVPSAFVEPFGN